MTGNPLDMNNGLKPDNEVRDLKYQVVLGEVRILEGVDGTERVCKNDYVPRGSG